MCKSAYYYLALAEYYREQYEKEQNIDLLKYAMHLYHYSAHALRRIGHYSWAGKAYTNSGIIFKETCNQEDKLCEIDFRIHSLSRARMCFEEIGDLELAEKIYIEEQELKFQKKKSAVKWLWKVCTRYGTSCSGLIVLLIIDCILFTGLYEFLHTHHELLTNCGVKWTPILSSFYFTIVNISTLGSGDIYPSSPGAQAIIITNVLSGYMILGLSISIITRYIRNR